MGLVMAHVMERVMAMRWLLWRKAWWSSPLLWISDAKRQVRETNPYCSSTLVHTVIVKHRVIRTLDRLLRVLSGVSPDLGFYSRCPKSHFDVLLFNLHPPKSSRHAAIFCSTEMISPNDDYLC